jgi:ribose transport system substrate-binding protein
MKAFEVGRIAILLLWLMAWMLTGCSPPEATEPPISTTAEPPVEAGDPAAGLAELRGKVFSTGPNGETSTASSQIMLTDEELQQIREMEATAAIVMHYGANDWSKAQIDGLQTQFEVMGIEVVSESEADFEAERQAANLRNVLEQEPDIIATFPLAPAEVFKEAADQGAKIVFMDMLPSGMALEHGEDYVSIVSADSYGNGIASAHLLAQHLSGVGRIGMVFHQVDFFVTHQRYLAFKETLQTYYPDIEIVAEQGMSGPDYMVDGEQAATAILAEYPDLDGIWAPWDVPAEGVMAAAQAAGRSDLAITTIDLGLNVAVAMAQGDMIVGVGAQRPYDQGVVEAKLAGYALLGKSAPPYVVLSALPVTPEDVLRAWRIVYHQSPPEALTEAAE